MKRYLFILIVIGIVACKSKDKVVQSENDVDAARNFIQAALEGDFDKARALLLPDLDSTNIKWLNAAERNYLKADAETKYGYRSASIHIHEISHLLKDSVSVVVYSNSLMNNRDTLKVVKKNGQWLIDLKFLYEHDADTIKSVPLLKDSIK